MTVVHISGSLNAVRSKQKTANPGSVCSPGICCPYGCLLLVLILSRNLIEEFQRSLFVQRIAHVEEHGQRNILNLLIRAADIDRNRLLRRLAVTQNQNVRRLELLIVLNLLLHVPVGVIRLGANAVLLQEVKDTFCILVVLLANRHNADLRGREPERENTLEVLDDDADEALQ